MKYVKFNYRSVLTIIVILREGAGLGSLLLLAAVKSAVHSVLDFTPECMCLLFTPISDDNLSGHMTAHVKSMSSQ